MRRSIEAALLALAALIFVSMPAQSGGPGGRHGGGRGWHGGYGHYGYGYGYRHGYGGGYYGYGYGGGFYGYRYPRVVIGVGLPGFWGGAPYYGYGYGYWPPGYVYAPARVVVSERPVPVERSASAPPAYWFYCPSEEGYYPEVQECPEAWVPVRPHP